MIKTLLIYYTLEGNTGYVADILSENEDITVEQLLPQKEPPRNGLKKFLVGGKSALAKDDPVLAPVKADVDGFSNIIIAFPVWAGTFPPAIGTFLKQHPLKNKNIYIIACSASGNANKAIDNIKRTIPDNRFVAELSLMNPLRDKEGTKAKVENFLI